VPTGKRSKAAVAKQASYIPVPDEFLNIVGEAWAYQGTLGLHICKPGSCPQIDCEHDSALLDVLIHSVRRFEVKDLEGAHRSKDIVRLLQYANDEGFDWVEMSRNDFDWMKARLTEQIRLWASADWAHLMEWLSNNVQTKEPKEPKESKESTAAPVSPDGVAVEV